MSKIISAFGHEFEVSDEQAQEWDKRIDLHANNNLARRAIMSKHTAGPWHVAAEVRTENASTSGYAIRDAGHDLVALCALGDDARETDYDKSETAANARLIASAPELLAALARIDEFASRQCAVETDEGALWAQCAAIARAAIAYATDSRAAIAKAQS